MIKEDRIQLNNRFIKVFKMLEDRGVIVKNDRSGKGIGDFAEKILGEKGYGHIVRAYLNPKDKRVIDYRHARAICSEYGVSESYLLDGIGSPFGNETPRYVSSDMDPALIGGNISYSSAEAFAGSTLGQEAPEVEQKFSIPGVLGNDLFAFPIAGNSMEPVIHNQDIIISRSVKNINDIKDNQIYAISHEGKLWVKYVKKIVGNRKKITALNCISANNIEHDPFVIEVNETTRLFKVEKRISEIN